MATVIIQGDGMPHGATVEFTEDGAFISSGGLIEWYWQNDELLSLASAINENVSQ